MRHGKNYTYFLGDISARKKYLIYLKMPNTRANLLKKHQNAINKAGKNLKNAIKEYNKSILAFANAAPKKTKNVKYGMDPYGGVIF